MRSPPSPIGRFLESPNCGLVEGHQTPGLHSSAKHEHPSGLQVQPRQFPLRQRLGRPCSPLPPPFMGGKDPVTSMTFIRAPSFLTTYRSASYRRALRSSGYPFGSPIRPSRKVAAIQHSDNTDCHLRPNLLTRPFPSGIKPHTAALSTADPRQADPSPCHAT